MCIDPYPTIEQQIRVDAILSRQLHEEYHIQVRKQMNQLDDKQTEYFCTENIEYSFKQPKVKYLEKSGTRWGSNPHLLQSEQVP